MVYKDVRAIAKVKLLIALCIAKAAHFLYLGFELTEFERAVHFDAFYLAFVPKNTLNKLAFGVSLMEAYYCVVLFLQPNYSLNRMLRDVLIRKNHQWFLGSHHKEVECCAVVKQRFLVVLNAFQSFTLVTGISLVVPF